MIVAVAYDISGNKRRTRLAKLLSRHGERVQKSIFEMDLEEKELTRLVRRIEGLIDLETDSVRVYRIPPAAYLESLWIGQKVEVREKKYYLL